MQEKLPSLVLTTYGMVSRAFFLKQDASHILLQGKCSVFKPRANLMGMLERERQMSLLFKHCPSRTDLVEVQRVRPTVVMSCSTFTIAICLLNSSPSPTSRCTQTIPQRKGFGILNEAWGGESRAMRMLEFDSNLIVVMPALLYRWQ
jgi:hypothetical protein